MKIAVCQINHIIGDIAGNSAKIIKYLKKAQNQGADIAVFPETAISGYPCGDLWQNKDFIKKQLKALREISKYTKKTACIIGYVDFNDKVDFLENACAFIYKGKILGKSTKMRLALWDVFYDPRYFVPAEKQKLVNFKGKKIGMTICADIFAPDKYFTKNPLSYLKGADFITHISASPYFLGRIKSSRNGRVIKSAKKLKRPIVMCNMIGANDDIIYDGGSTAFDKNGNTIAKAKSWQEDMFVVDLKNQKKVQAYKENETDEIYNALVLGIKDFFAKNKIKRAIIGLSGGIDSAVVTCLAVKALGNKNVYAYYLPSKYSSSLSEKLADKLAKNLKVNYKKISIKKMHQSFGQTFGEAKSLTDQNIQARIRGDILMSISSEIGGLVLACSNKTEVACGYSTMYGDTCGGLMPIGDLLKHRVVELANYINADCEIIPSGIISRPPSAELKPNQKDEDDLPRYEILDKIVELYVEQEYDATKISKKLKLGKNFVKKIIDRIERAEFKRYQAPPILKITKKAFGSGRKMQIAKKL